MTDEPRDPSLEALLGRLGDEEVLDPTADRALTHRSVERILGRLSTPDVAPQAGDEAMLERAIGGAIDALVDDPVLGRDLAGPDAMPGDDAMIERAIAAALSHAPSIHPALRSTVQPGPTRDRSSGGLGDARWAAAAVVMLALVGAATAAAARLDVVRDLVESWTTVEAPSAPAEHAAERTAPAERPSRATDAVADAPAVTELAVAEEPALDVDDVVPSDELEAPPRARRRGARRAAAPVEDEPTIDALPTTPEALLQAANQARAEGRADDAAAAYRDLQRNHPTSRAARVSRVSLGRLLLRQGRADEALASFDAYLRTSPQGSLAEAARSGRAVSLERLGRDGDARRAWEQVLRHHPDSPVAARARQALQR